MLLVIGQHGILVLNWLLINLERVPSMDLPLFRWNLPLALAGFSFSIKRTNWPTRFVGLCFLYRLSALAEQMNISNRIFGNCVLKQNLFNLFCFVQKNRYVQYLVKYLTDKVYLFLSEKLLQSNMSYLSNK